MTCTQCGVKQDVGWFRKGLCSKKCAILSGMDIKRGVNQARTYRIGPNSKMGLGRKKRKEAGIYGAI